jgi:plasmid maintenance system antidote protein VapI
MEKKTRQHVDPAFLVGALREECQRLGSQSEFARVNDFSRGFISDVLAGRRDVTETLARKLGYRRLMLFEKSEETE